ncbi:MAG: exosortase family protein XrtF [Flavobacteriales bacterium]|nr:exosortase family protein XrtF [Flavobacteriales bacterium]
MVKDSQKSTTNKKSEFRVLLLLLAKFIGLYLVLIFVYNLYLTYFNDTLQTCDPFTEIVANQSVRISKWIGLDVSTGKADPFPYISLLMERGKRYAIVNEGCNALSVMIVFVAFIFAFPSRWYKTLSYIVLGILFLHITNISRIALLSYTKINYPEYYKMSHDYLFPVIIYGAVIILWIVWVQFFLTKKKGSSTRSTDILILLVLLLGLVGVRYVESDWFYDPFLRYFKTLSSEQIFPEVNFYKLTISHVFRYLLNALLSSAIVYFWFREFKYAKYSFYLFVLVFLILYPMYLYQIYHKFELGEMPVFYIRRFLIQPILLFVLIPSFYFLQFIKRKNRD